MSTRSRIQDGTGTTGRAAVFNHRMRTFATEQSLTNHISTSILQGRTGVFTVRNFIFFNIGAGSGNAVLMSISNNDPINILIIDRSYVQISSSSVTLPDPTLLIAIDNQVGNSNIPISNENRFSTINPLVKAINQTTLGGSGAFLSTDIIRIYPTLGDLIELIPLGSDAIILPGSITPTITGSPTTGGRGSNTFSIKFYKNNTAAQNYSFEVFIRFMMVPPDQLG